MLISHLTAWLQRHAPTSSTALVDRAARSVGLRITLMANTLDGKRADLLTRLGIKVVLDVGANEGQYASEIRRQGFKGRIISFEPVQEAYERLSERSVALDPHVACHVALGRDDGVQRFTVTLDSTCSSLFTPLAWFTEAHPGAQPGRTIDVEVRRLDSLAHTILGPHDVAWLKLDTQGTEADVLEGARAILGQIAGIEIEMSTIRLYESQRLLPDLWHQLTQAGFEPYWLERGYRDPRSGRLAQLDGLFVRADFLPDKQS